MPKPSYNDFLKSKTVIAEKYGFEPRPQMGDILPHAEAITQWALKGGRRAIFASFGLTKTAMQLELAYQVIAETNKPFLICMPLGVMGEFKRDNKDYFNGKYETVYITDTDEVAVDGIKIYLTNYERVRKGDIDPAVFGGVSFDEASMLRNLKTETTNYILDHFKTINYRFVATATPSPNDFKEILNYADYLGVADRGHILTRFFKRNPQKAGDLTLMPNKKREFWQWVSTWAVFITDPADLGFPSDGYDLPELNIIKHRIDRTVVASEVDYRDQIRFIRKRDKSLAGDSREKRESIGVRLDKVFEILEAPENLNDHFIIWHHLEDERRAIEKRAAASQVLTGELKSVFGGQTNIAKEDLLVDYSDGKFKYLNTKPQIAGSGCNFQHAAHKCIFAGINPKFNDFIQAVHRIYRFKQKYACDLHLIYTNNEDHIYNNLMRKWNQHKEQQTEMVALVREYGLNDDLIKSQMERQVFQQGDKVQIGDATLYNNDNVIVLSDHTHTGTPPEIADDSIHHIVTSIPFGDHYEYSSFYNDFGHNFGNGKFFVQMGYLIPQLWRVLKPGRVAAIHVKDRIRYSHQNGTSFTTIDAFSDDTITAFTKKDVKAKLDFLKDSVKLGMIPESAEVLNTIADLEADYAQRFYLMSRITITTDVVAENNQTYRLGHSEQCKDGSKMGAGLPEYLLLFRKAPTHSDNAYADEKVSKQRGETRVTCNSCKNEISIDRLIESNDAAETFELHNGKPLAGNLYHCPSCAKMDTFECYQTPDEYPVSQWQIDAHAYWKSSGNRQLPVADLLNMNLKQIHKAWKQYQLEGLYDFEYHKELSYKLSESGRLSKKYMRLPPLSNHPEVWTDIRRTNTLNTNQVSKKKEKHICPLQLDIIERSIERFTMPGETVLDPFNGLASTAYQSLKMARKAIGIELNTDYYKDGLFYIRALNDKINTPSLFDVAEMED